MKKFTPPLLCLFLCGILVLSCARLALGAELEPVPPDCFRSKSEGLVLYRSPVAMELSRAEESGSTVPHFPELYGLDDLENPDSFVCVYPLRPGEAPPPDTAYRRVDLEDAEFLEGATAKRLRAVVLGSYPAKDIHSLQHSANAWLRSEGRTELTELETGEAVLATQGAIWTLTGQGSGLSLERLYSPQEGQEESKTAGNIQGLYDYLLALPEEGARYDTVSPRSLKEAVLSRPQADGTALLTVEVDTSVSPQDFVTLTAFRGEERRSQLVSAKGEYQFRFENQAGEAGAVLELSGRQYGSDVSLFQPQDPTAPWLISYHSGTHPVYARQTVVPVPEEPTEPEAPTEATEAVEE